MPDPARLKGFLAAMTGISRGANLGIAEKFPWSEYKTFVDAGTAQGDLATQVALAHPHLTGQEPAEQLVPYPRSLVRKIPELVRVFTQVVELEHLVVILDQLVVVRP